MRWPWQRKDTGESIFKPRVEEPWIAQLIAINDDGEVLTEWAPIKCSSQEEADQTATQLMMDNRWGAPGRWPDTRVFKDTGRFVDGN